MIQVVVEWFCVFVIEGITHCMTDNQSQDERKNPHITPSLPITELASIFGYSRSHIKNLVRYGYLHSYKVKVRGRECIMVHVASMNAYVKMQENRRRNRD